MSNNTGSRESALVQLDSADFGTLKGVVYANERNLGPAPGVRMHDVSLDGGASFAPSLAGTDSDLPDVDTGNWTGVVSGLARLSPPASAAGRSSSSSLRGVASAAPGDFLLFTAPFNTIGQRVNLTAFVTAGVTGEPSAWRPSRIGPIWAQDAAYSDTLQINSTHVGVLFECGTGGDFAAQIAFAAIPIADL